jgi:hypothetical protein
VSELKKNPEQERKKSCFDPSPHFLATPLKTHALQYIRLKAASGSNQGEVERLK